MTNKRVAITGVGPISSVGIGIDEFWANLLEGKSGVKKITKFNPESFDNQIAGEIEGFSARKCVPKNYRKAVKVMARDIELAVGAADAAFRDSGIETKGTSEEPTIESSRLGCNIGAGLICCELDEMGLAATTAVTDGKFDLKAWGETGMQNLTPLWLLKYLPNMLSCHVTIIHGAEGPSNCITCGDAASHLGVGESSIYIKRGAADAVITGGAESKLNLLGHYRPTMMGRLCSNSNDNPETAVKSFDKNHAGTVIGEGGGLLILEDMERAKKRGANIYAEVVGFGAACDPQGIVLENPTAGNLGQAALSAIKNAGITTNDIDAIFATGTGVPGEDTAEAAEWKKVFGERLPEIPACSITGATGTAFAGNGGLQIVAAAKSVKEQTLPPTINFESPAEGCDLNLSAKAREVEITYIITGTFTVGGQSGVCVLKKVEA